MFRARYWHVSRFVVKHCNRIPKKVEECSFCLSFIEGNKKKMPVVLLFCCCRRSSLMMIEEEKLIIKSYHIVFIALEIWFRDRKDVAILWKALRGKQGWVLWVFCGDKEGNGIWQFESSKHSHQIQEHYC